MYIKVKSIYDREKGSLLAPFERELMFGRKDEHIGWVVPTGKRTFKLRYSPFSKLFRMDPKYNSEIIYVVEDPSLMPPEGECVEVEGRLIYEKSVSRGGYRCQVYCLVESYSKFPIRSLVQSLKPDIDYKDFLYFCSVVWDFAYEDDLDKMIALSLVSCPPSFYGRGGFGGITANMTKLGTFGSRYPAHIRKTFGMLIPSEFKAGRTPTPYKFKVVSRPKDAVSAFALPASEVNYTTACATDAEVESMSRALPYQLPILVRHAEYNHAKEELADISVILQYQLTALILTPNFSDSQIKLIERNIEKAKKAWYGVDDVVRIDPHAVNRLALGLSRLHLEPDLKEKRIKEAIRFIIDQRKDWEDYKQVVKGVTSFRRQAPLTYRDNLTKKEIEILVALKRVHEEQGFKWTDSSYLKAKYFKKMNHEEFLNHLINLSNAGLILQRNNFSLVRLTFEEIYPDDDYL